MYSLGAFRVQKVKAIVYQRELLPCVIVLKSYRKLLVVVVKGPVTL